MRLLALLVALLLVAAPARSEIEARVTGEEYNAVSVGDSMARVHAVFGTTGDWREAWTGEDGLPHQRRWYHTSQGYGTHVTGIYEATGDPGWVLVLKKWCQYKDTARDIVSDGPGFTCFDTPPFGARR